MAEFFGRVSIRLLYRRFQAVEIFELALRRRWKIVL